MTPNDYDDAEFIKWRDKVHDLEIAVARLQEQEKAADRALILANEALKHNQQVSNEWRKENIDQRALYPTSPKVDGQFATEASERRALENRVVILEKAGSGNEGKHAAFDSIWLKLTVIATLIMTALGLAYKFVMGK